MSRKIVRREMPNVAAASSMETRSVGVGSPSGPVIEVT
jgi:hypothetical protein